MKDLIETTDVLHNLSEYCKKESLAVGKSLLQRQAKTSATLWHKTSSLTKEQREFTENKSARVIQRFWRTYKTKEFMAKDCYQFYTSLTSSEDSFKQLSDLMFDLHVAELSLLCKEASRNPLANKDGKYHRQFLSSKKLVEKLLLSFDVSQEDMEKNIYVPVMLLENSPVESIISQYHRPPIAPFTLLKRSDKSIALVMMAKENPAQAQMQKTLAAAGIVASLWEIAQNITFPESTKEAIHPPAYTLKAAMTKVDLLKSSCFRRVKLIADNTRYPTHLLAQCLCKLIQSAPELQSNAIRRMVLMLEMTTTFYAQHYVKFAACIYTVVHEISLAMLKQTSADIETLYTEFWQESETTLLHALDIQKEQLENCVFFAAPTISGANAFTIAMQLASKMQVGAQEKPTIKIIEPTYYEFDYIFESTMDVNPDIFVFCAGPMVNINGLIPGIDINRFVRNHILSNPRLKPTTLVIDATTALYKNLKLEPDVKELVEKGLVSIIVNESHQKFGLLHTDQAQYGRTFALCSKSSFVASDISEMQRATQLDFQRHVDMQVGAFLNVACKEVLEQIKEQHFRNGALLGTAETPALNQDMLTNLNELYFFSGRASFLLRRAAASTVETRDSFGHFFTTGSLIGDHVRISPDASDVIDTLIQGAKLSIAMDYSIMKLENMIIQHGQFTHSLTLEHQIVSLAILHNIAQDYDPSDLVKQIDEAFAEREKEIGESTYNSYKESIKIDKEALSRIELLNIQCPDVVEMIQSHIKENEQFMAEYEERPLRKIKLFAAMNSVLEQCTLLTGRSMYMSVGRYLTSFYQEIIKEHCPASPPLFFQAVTVLYQQNIPLTHELLAQLKSNPLFCERFVVDQKRSSAKLGARANI